MSYQIVVARVEALEQEMAELKKVIEDMDSRIKSSNSSNSSSPVRTSSEKASDK
jgi:cell division septum initiation protein DivIVA